MIVKQDLDLLLVAVFVSDHIFGAFDTFFNFKVSTLVIKMIQLPADIISYYSFCTIYNNSSIIRI